MVFGWLLFHGFEFNVLIYKVLHYGGFGKGAYYPWIYLQMAILLPLVHPILKKMTPPHLLLFFLVICEGLEILCSIIDLPDWIYRLLSIRYFFLIYLALIWIKKGIEPNWKMLLLSLLSLATIVYFRYFSVNDEPWFYNTAWKTARWPCYYYVANLYVYMLYLLWATIKKYDIVSKCVKRIASSTYEIFLIQMSVIYLFHVNHVKFITNELLRYIIWIIIVWSISLGLGIGINMLINRKSGK